MKKIKSFFFALLGISSMIFFTACPKTLTTPTIVAPVEYVEVTMSGVTRKYEKINIVQNDPVSFSMSPPNSLSIEAAEISAPNSKVTLSVLNYGIPINFPTCDLKNIFVSDGIPLPIWSFNGSYGFPYPKVNITTNGTSVGSFIAGNFIAPSSTGSFSASISFNVKRRN